MAVSPITIAQLATATGTTNTISDSWANISAALSTTLLTKAANYSTITITSGTATASQLLSLTPVLAAKLVGLKVSDTAAALTTAGAALTALNTLVAAHQATVTINTTVAISLAQNDALKLLGAQAASATVLVTVQDTVANILAHKTDTDLAGKTISKFYVSGAVTAANVTTLSTDSVIKAKVDLSSTTLSVPLTVAQADYVVAQAYKAAYAVTDTVANLNKTLSATTVAHLKAASAVTATGTVVAADFAKLQTSVIGATANLAAVKVSDTASNLLDNLAHLPGAAGSVSLKTTSDAGNTVTVAEASQLEHVKGLNLSTNTVALKVSDTVANLTSSTALKVITAAGANAQVEVSDDATFTIATAHKLVLAHAVAATDVQLTISDKAANLFDSSADGLKDNAVADVAAVKASSVIVTGAVTTANLNWLIAASASTGDVKAFADHVSLSAASIGVTLNVAQAAYATAHDFAGTYTITDTAEHIANGAANITDLARAIHVTTAATHEQQAAFESNGLVVDFNKVSGSTGTNLSVADAQYQALHGGHGYSVTGSMAELLDPQNSVAFSHASTVNLSVVLANVLTVADLTALKAIHGFVIPANVTIHDSLVNITASAITTPVTFFQGVNTISVTDATISQSQLTNLATYATKVELTVAQAPASHTGVIAFNDTAANLSSGIANVHAGDTVTVSDSASLVALLALQAKITTVVAPAIPGTLHYTTVADNVGNLTTAANATSVIDSAKLILAGAMTVTVSDAATLAQIAAIDNATAATLTYSLTGAASDFFTIATNTNSTTLTAAATTYVTSGHAVTLTGLASVAQLNALSALVDVTASISGTAAVLKTLTDTGNHYAVTVIGQAQMSDLATIFAAGTSSIACSDVIGTASQYFDIAAGVSTVKSYVTSGAKVTITDTVTVAQLKLLDAANGSAAVTYAGITGSAIDYFGSGSTVLVTVTGHAVTVTDGASMEQLALLTTAAGGTGSVTGSVIGTAASIHTSMTNAASTNIANAVIVQNNVANATAVSDLKYVFNHAAKIVDATAVTAISGTLAEIKSVLVTAGPSEITLKSIVDVTLTGTQTVVGLNSIDANANVGVVTATMAGTATALKALTGTANAYTLQVAAGTEKATDLSALDLKTTATVDASKVTKITGSAAEIAAVLEATVSNISHNLTSSLTLDLNNTTLTATDLSKIVTDNTNNAKVNLGTVTTITGASSAAVLAALQTSSAGGTALKGDVAVTIAAGSATIASELISINGATTGLVTLTGNATITGTAQNVATALNKSTVVIATGANVTLDAGAVSALDLGTIIGKVASGVVNAAALTSISGTAAEINALTGSTSIDHLKDHALTVTVTSAATSNTVSALNNIYTGIHNGAGVSDVVNAVIVVTAGITGAVTDLKLLTGTGNDYTVTLTDTTAVAADLNTIDLVTTKNVAAGSLTAITGAAADIATALTATTITQNANLTVTVSTAAVANASDLNTIDGKTDKVVTATAVTGITGSSSDVLKLLNASSTVTLSGTETVAVTGSANASDLNSIDTKVGTVPAPMTVTATGVTAITGTLADISTAITAAKITANTISLNSNFDLTVSGVIAADATSTITTGTTTVINTGVVAVVAALDAASGSGIITASLKGTVAQLTSVVSGNHLTIEVSDAATLDQLQTIDGKTDIDFTNYSGGITGAASDYFTNAGTNASVKTSLAATYVNGDHAVTVTTGTLTAAEAHALDDATAGVVTASVSGTSAELKDFDTNNKFTLLITEGASLAQLKLVSAATATSISDIALNYFSLDGKTETTDATTYLKSTPVTNVNVTVEDKVSLAQLTAIDKVNGSGTLIYSAEVSGSVTELTADHLLTTINGGGYVVNNDGTHDVVVTSAVKIAELAIIDGYGIAGAVNVTVADGGKISDTVGNLLANTIYTAPTVEVSTSASVTIDQALALAAIANIGVASAAKLSITDNVANTLAHIGGVVTALDVNGTGKVVFDVTGNVTGDEMSSLHGMAVGKDVTLGLSVFSDTLTMSDATWLAQHGYTSQITEFTPDALGIVATTPVVIDATAFNLDATGTYSYTNLLKAAVTAGWTDISYKGLGTNETINLTGFGSVTTTPVRTSLIIDGGAGNDVITGTSQDDIIIGGTGDDTLIGGAGVDLLTGNAGKDIFKFAAGDSAALNATQTTVDVIADFANGSDMIRFGSTLYVAAPHTSSVQGNATIMSGGVANFDNSDTSFTQHLTAVAAALDGAAKGTAVEWSEDISNSYVYITDGVAGAGANDVLIKLVGVSNGGLTVSGMDITHV